MCKLHIMIVTVSTHSFILLSLIVLEIIIIIIYDLPIGLDFIDTLYVRDDIFFAYQINKYIGPALQI